MIHGQDDCSIQEKTPPIHPCQGLLLRFFKYILNMTYNSYHEARPIAPCLTKELSTYAVEKLCPVGLKVLVLSRRTKSRMVPNEGLPIIRIYEIGDDSPWAIQCFHPVA